jgi:hypothetical protein
MVAAAPKIDPVMIQTDWYESDLEVAVTCDGVGEGTEGIMG